MGDKLVKRRTQEGGLLEEERDPKVPPPRGTVIEVCELKDGRPLDIWTRAIVSRTLDATKLGFFSAKDDEGNMWVLHPSDSALWRLAKATS